MIAYKVGPNKYAAFHRGTNKTVSATGSNVREAMNKAFAKLNQVNKPQ
jgi:predicted Fe-Mo cluster-binding NifX family protein